MSTTANSKAAFLSQLSDLNLLDIKEKFVENGWETFGDFGFGCSCQTDTKSIEDEIVKPLCGENKVYAARIRRLFAMSFVIASAEAEKFLSPDADPVIKLHPAEREERRNLVSSRITGFVMTGELDPSARLIDKCVTILNTGAVKYIAWAKCTTAQSELIDVHEVVGLRLDDKGLLVRAAPSEGPDTDTSTDLLLDNTLRRRALAADIASLCQYEVMQLWHEQLKAALLRVQPPGFSKVSYSQIRNADQELWRRVAEKCRSGCKRPSPTEPSAFETAFKALCFDSEVRIFLSPLPRGTSSSSSASPASSSFSGPSDSALAKQNQKLANSVSQLRNEIANLKRKSNSEPEHRPNKTRRGTANRPNNDDKGKGKGTGSVPQGLIGKRTKTDAGDSLCYNFNLPKGCSLAPPGSRCQRGWHLCAEPGCAAPHSLQSHR